MPGGRVPQARDIRAGGDRLDLSDLARTLRAVAEHGAQALYDGPIAQAIHREMRRLGGLLDAADLTAYRPRIAVEDRHRYRALEISTCGDTIAVETLNILERFDLVGQPADGAMLRHLLAEAQAQAFVDAFAYAGDPAEGDTPVAGLTSKAYAATLAARIAPTRAQETVVAGDPWAWQAARPAGGRLADRRAVAPLEGTTKICAADRRGNTVSLITSLGSAFGSLVLVPGTGIYLGNAMQWFDPRPGRVNSVAPGRMPLYGAPVLIAYDGCGACGALAGSGGYYIQSAVLLPFVYHADLGVPLQAALEMPRQFCRGEDLELDSRVGEECRQALVEMGHRVTVVPYSPLSRRFGRSAAVWRDEDGALHAACEPLDGGAAAA
jgi:gamma-glutamyltranspeptidase/glutathione hydrolase